MVRTLMHSWAAICALMEPRATRVTRSCSRGTELAPHDRAVSQLVLPDSTQVVAGGGVAAL